MTSDEQLNAWVNGESIHNHDKVVNIVDENDQVLYTEKVYGGECCPDFSCCEPALLWPKELRQKFKDATEAVRSEMLMMSLQQLVHANVKSGTITPTVHVVGDAVATKH